MRPQHVGEVIDGEGSVLELVVGDVEREEAGRFGHVILRGIGDKAIGQLIEGAEVFEVVQRLAVAGLAARAARARETRPEASAT
jgi:hypothetical protein